MPLVGFRANTEKHKRILDWLEPFSEKKGRSDETRRLIELGMDVSEGKYVLRGQGSQREARSAHLPWLNNDLKL